MTGHGVDPLVAQRETVAALDALTGLDWVVVAAPVSAWAQWVCMNAIDGSHGRGTVVVAPYVDGACRECAVEFVRARLLVGVEVYPEVWW